MSKGWRSESHRHSLSARGIRTVPRNMFKSRGVSKRGGGLNHRRAREIPLDELFSMLEWSDSYRNVYPKYMNDEYVNEYSDEYYFDSKEDAEAFAEEVYGTFESLPEPIPIFRTIFSQAGMDVLEKPFGEHWSWDRESAVRFGKRNYGKNNLFLIEGFVSSDDVGWWTTVENHVRFSIHMTDENEYEIYVPSDGDEVYDTKIVEVE